MSKLSWVEILKSHLSPENLKKGPQAHPNDDMQILKKVQKPLDRP